MKKRDGRFNLTEDSTGIVNGKKDLDDDSISGLG